MGDCGTAQSTEVVSAFEQRHDAAFSVMIGYLLDAFGDPAVVSFDQAQRRHIVVAMRVEAGGNENRLRLKRRESGKPMLLNDLTESRAVRRG
jgi:hypothetical protein